MHRFIRAVDGYYVLSCELFVTLLLSTCMEASLRCLIFWGVPLGPLLVQQVEITPTLLGDVLVVLNDHCLTSESPAQEGANYTILNLMGRTWLGLHVRNSLQLWCQEGLEIWLPEILFFTYSSC